MPLEYWKASFFVGVLVAATHVQRLDPCKMGEGRVGDRTTVRHVEFLDAFQVNEVHVRDPRDRAALAFGKQSLKSLRW